MIVFSYFFTEMKKIYLALLAIAFCACSDSESPTGGEGSVGALVDSRDSRTYKTLEIGGRVWMAENLNYQGNSDGFVLDTVGGWLGCFENNVNYCEKQGRLYQWGVAMNACPEGWKLPSKADFESLLAAVGGGATAADSLTSLGFISEINGGYYYMGYFSFYDKYAYFWTSDEVRANNAYSVMFEKGRSSVSFDQTYEQFGLSVRCIKER